MMEDACETERQLRADLARFGRLLGRLGFTPGTSGNLSARLDADRLLVTPTGMSKGFLRAADMVIVDLNGKQLQGTRRVTSEITMHLAVYQLRADVHAVIHSHPPIATGFACSGRALEEVLCQEAIMTIGTIPLAEYATTGTDEVAASLVPFIPGHEAILMANHGAVSYGATLLEAYQWMEAVEHLAHVSLVAHQLGSPRPLSAEQVARLKGARSRYVQNAASAKDTETSFAVATTNGRSGSSA